MKIKYLITGILVSLCLNLICNFSLVLANDELDMPIYDDLTISSSAVLISSNLNSQGIGMCEENLFFDNFFSGIMTYSDNITNASGYDENCTEWLNNHMNYYAQLGSDAYKFSNDITENTYKQIYNVFVSRFVDKNLTNIYCNQENGRYYAIVNISFDGINNSEENINAIKRAFNSARAAFYGDYPEFFGAWEDEIYCLYDNDLIIGAVMKVYIHNHLNDNGDLIYPTPNALALRYTRTLSIADDIVYEMQELNLPNKYSEVLYLFTEVCDRAEYSSTNTYCNEPDGILLDGKSKCLGYARAFQLLCQMADIPCITATGGGHAWNFVKIDGDWYFCDPTDADIRNGAYGYEYSYDRFLTERLSHISYNRFKELSTNSTPSEVQYLGYPEVSELPYLVKGDVNLDGEITNNDYSLVVAYVLNNSLNLSERQKINADVNGDGEVTATDAAMINQKVLNPSYEFNSIGSGVSVYSINQYDIVNNNELLEQINNIYISNGLPTISINDLILALEG